MDALKQLKNGVVVFFAALLAVGCFTYALRGLWLGDAFCLACSRSSAPAPWRETPLLFVISELMLLGLGIVCVLAAFNGLRDILRTRSGELDAASEDTSGPNAGSRPHASRTPSPRKSATASSRRAEAEAPSPLAGLLVHGIAAMCMIATLVLGGLAVTARHSSTDLGFGVLLLWLMPLWTFFLGSIFLAMSPRPRVSRVGWWLLMSMVGGAVILSLGEKLFR